MTWTDFTLRLFCAFVLGSLIGLERQWRHRIAGLRTNVLVSSGAALFVMLGGLMPAESSPTRIAAQVVSGIGFLGAGVIMREGLNVRGLNTAATLWCVAAVGTLAGSGMLWRAAIGSVGVLGANLLLRPIAVHLSRGPIDTTEDETHYQFRVVCPADNEVQVRALLLQTVGPTGLILFGLHSQDINSTGRVEVKAELKTMGRRDEVLEQIVSRLSLEPGVTTVSWQATPFHEGRV